MRSQPALALTLLLALTAGCAPANAAQQAAPPGPPPAPAYQPGQPVTSKDLAVAAALKSMEDPSFAWTEGPRPMLVEEMSYEQAYALLGFGQPGPDQFLTTPREARVWFVIVWGKWTLQPMGPPGAAPIPYEGCLLTIFTSRDGTMLSRGDSKCPGKG